MAMQQGTTSFGWKAPASVIVMLLALALAWYLWFPAAPGPFVVHLESGAGGINREPIAPPDRSLILHIARSVPPGEAVSWEVSVVEAATGASVLKRSGVRPSGDSLRVEIPAGLKRAGRYDVHVVQEGGSTGSPPVNEGFHFFIAEAP